MPGNILGTEDIEGNMKFTMKVIHPAIEYLKALHNCKNGVGEAGQALWT